MGLKEEPFVSVILLNHNGIQYVETCLLSVLNTDYPNFEVMFIDNASTDTSLKYVKERFRYFPKLKIIANNENTGYAEGNNIGIRHISPNAKYIVFLNYDTEVDSRWLIEAIKTMESDPLIGASQCKLMQMYNRSVIDSCGGFIDFLGYSYSEGVGEEDNEKFTKNNDIFYADGAAFVIRRDIINGILIDDSLFDSDYFAYHEDIDVCWRIRLRGYRVTLSPYSVVYHIRGRNSKSQITPPLLIFHHSKNRIVTLIKNYNWTNLVKWLPLLLIAETCEAVSTSMVRGDHSGAILRALFWVPKNLRNILRKRFIVQNSIRRVSDSGVMLFIVRPRFLYLLKFFINDLFNKPEKRLVA